MDGGDVIALQRSVAVAQNESGFFVAREGEDSARAKAAGTADAVLRRGLDIIAAGALILFLFPLLLFIGLVIFTADGGPILFGHNRIGRGGQIIKCWKFRSMVMDSKARLERLLQSDPEAEREWKLYHKLKVDPRITPFGAFLRRSSLDELPQLLNVLVGEMSLVGPRPIVTDERAKYGSRFRTYCSVTPGITGLWQVSGRNNTSYRRRVALDCVYVRDQSVLLNIKILAATLPAVIFSKGAY